MTALPLYNHQSAWITFLNGLRQRFLVPRTVRSRRIVLSTTEVPAGNLPADMAGISICQDTAEGVFRFVIDSSFAGGRLQILSQHGELRYDGCIHAIDVVSGASLREGLHYFVFTNRSQQLIRVPFIIRKWNDQPAYL